MLWSPVLLAALVVIANNEAEGSAEAGPVAGNFFADTPKSAPRMGRRSETPTEKKAERVKYFYAAIPKAMPRIGRRSSRPPKPILVSEHLRHLAASYAPLVGALQRRFAAVDRNGNGELSLAEILDSEGLLDVMRQNPRSFDFQTDSGDDTEPYYDEQVFDHDNRKLWN